MDSAFPIAFKFAQTVGISNDEFITSLFSGYHSCIMKQIIAKAFNSGEVSLQEHVDILTVDVDSSHLDDNTEYIWFNFFEKIDENYLSYYFIEKKHLISRDSPKNFIKEYNPDLIHWRKNFIFYIGMYYHPHPFFNQMEILQEYINRNFSAFQIYFQIFVDCISQNKTYSEFCKIVPSDTDLLLCMSVSISDDYFETDHRFFRIASQLPLELQSILCKRARHKNGIFARTTACENAFRIIFK